MIKTIISLFIMGLAFGSGPCLASCGPILISYIAGTRKNILESISVYFLFSLARVAVYLVLGIVIFFLGKFIIEIWLGRISRYLFILTGVFLIILGMLTAGGRHLEFSRILQGGPWIRRPSQLLQKNLLALDKKSVILMGLLIGILPCGPLLALLSYVGLVSKTGIEALFYSFSFGLGTVLSPLLILSALAGLIPRFLSGQRGIYYKAFSFVCGLVIIFLGIQLISRAI